jgi:hypothetical protein
VYNAHIQRIKDRLSNAYSLSNLSHWIEKNTTLNSKRYSFEGREYQRDIIDHPALTLIVVKCAQVGLSEIFARWSLAAVCTQDDFTVITTFPNSTDSELFSKSRLEPVIQGSKLLRESVSKHVNSVELRQFGANSFLYTRGTKSETGALSVPADLILHDELDRSNMDNVSAYVSRLQARPTKMRRLFSTPTVAKYGIDAEASTAKRYRQMWKCSHCNHTFIPSYESDVHIPGYSGDKKGINRHTLKDLRYREARLLCPNCGLVPESGLKYREWVLENPADNFDAIAYYVAPFCAPSFITPAYLVKASTDFAKWSEFKNQALGETEEDSEECLVVSDIKAADFKHDLDSSDLHYLGADMGLTCHITIGRMHDGKILVVHRCKVSFSEFEEKRRELCARYKVLISVHDMFPYTDIVSRITNFDPNAYGAMYVTKKSTENFSVRDQEENAEMGKLNVRALMVNREVALDSLMAEFKRNNLVIRDVDDEFIQHMLSMKRVQQFDKQQNMHYAWKKTDGLDHYHHSLLYLYLAISLRGTASGYADYGQIPLVHSFQTKQVALPMV